MPNELVTGSRRSGDLIDFDTDTPEVKVTLERSENRISVTVPWSSPESPYAEWFMGDERWMHPASEHALTRPRHVPKRLLFRDSHGSILLVNCWPSGFHTDMFGPGSGTVLAQVAVLGLEGDIEFDRPHGLTTEISSLREWLGVSSWSVTFGVDQGQDQVVIRSDPASSVDIAAVDGVSLSLRPSWQLAPDDARDCRTLRDLVYCRTRSVEDVPWATHLNLHHAVRDLLVLSRWTQESCVAVFALRQDDPVRTMDDSILGEQWRDVVVANGDRKPPLSGYRPHLIHYNDLGPTGLANWIDLRDEFARALDPVISSIQLPKSTPHTLLAHTGPGLEALGYLLMRRDGVGAKKAADAGLRERLERVLLDVDPVLPFDGPGWVQRTVRAYNGLKHANRTKPDSVDVLNVWRESVLLVRAWVALELGVRPAELTERIASDAQQNEYIRRV